jgi:hypothetical protein
MQRTGAAQAEGDREAARQPLSVTLLDGDDMALPVLKLEQLARMMGGRDGDERTRQFGLYDMRVRRLADADSS